MEIAHYVRSLISLQIDLYLAGGFAFLEMGRNNSHFVTIVVIKEVREGGETFLSSASRPTTCNDEVRLDRALRINVAVPPQLDWILQ